MHRIVFKSKIHRVVLTGKALGYEGSIALDRRLMDEADLFPGEQVHVLNVNTGDRLVTYVIEAPEGTGTVMLNGPAARLGEVGDPVIVLAYGLYSDAEARQLMPKIVHVDEQNAPVIRPIASESAQSGIRPAGRSALPSRHAQEENYE